MRAADPNPGFWARLDARVAAVERALLLISVSAMTILVFADVVQRTFSRPIGKTASLMLWLIERFGPVPAARSQWVADVGGPAVFLLLASALVIGGVHAGRQNAAERAGQKDPLPFLPSLWRGALLFAAFVVAVRLTLWVFPSGIAGAQKLALGFLVWSGFLGASLATRAHRHIALDALHKKLPEPVRRPLGFLSGLTTAGFCFLISALATRKCATQIQEWAESDGVIHMMESVPVPEWVVSLALPLCFFITAARFLANGIQAARGIVPGGADAHGIDLEALRSGPSPSAEESQ